VIFAGLRGGLLVWNGLGVDAFGGFLFASLHQDRVEDADGPSGVTTVRVKSSEIEIKGPLALLGAKYQVLHWTPLTARLSAGFLFSQIDIAQGEVEVDQSEAPRVDLDGNVHGPATRFVIVPELRAGARFGAGFVLDLGILGVWMSLPDSPADPPPPVRVESNPPTTIQLRSGEGLTGDSVLLWIPTINFHVEI
jgi:hypothetical protein